MSRRVFRSTARARHDYATHLPILVGLAKSVPIRSVLELGCGYYSTSTFLDRRVFPHLHSLESYETDPVWAATIKSSINTDSRARLNLVSGSIADSLQRTDLEAYDLILVDDSKSAEDRTETIKTLVQRRPQRPIMVVHDFEVPAYADVAKSFRHRYSFRVFNPETGIVWEHEPKNRKGFKQIDAVLKKHSSKLEPEDVTGWIQAFTSAPPFTDT